MALPVKPNFAQDRQSLLQQFGFDPTALAGFQDNYLQESNNQYQTLADILAQSDIEENDLNTGYERSRSQAIEQQNRAVQALQSKMAFNGMQRSSAAVDEEAKLGQDYQRVLDELTGKFSTGAAQVAGKRSSADAAYKVGQGNLAETLRSGASSYLNDVAAKEAQRKIDQQTADAATASAGVSQQIANQTVAPINQANAAPIDLSRFANLFVQNTPQPAPAYTPLTNVNMPPKPSVYDPGRVALTSSVAKPKTPLTPLKGRS